MENYLKCFSRFLFEIHNFLQRRAIVLTLFSHLKIGSRIQADSSITEQRSSFSKFNANPTESPNTKLMSLLQLNVNLSIQVIIEEGRNTDCATVLQTVFC